ncbi:MAG: hypothetical protein U0136_05725 [Bdellovibrionota bacterium]
MNRSAHNMDFSRISFSRWIVCLGAVLFVAVTSSCSPFTTEPIPGPDKQSVGTFTGAALGAGSGAVVGAQVGAGSGPGAWVGAALGAIYGMFQGLGVDLLEEDELRRLAEEQHTREIAWVQELLAEHYARRLELHPTRDIFPADWFFDTDSAELKPEAVALAHELGLLTKQRMPWSRIVVAAYVTTTDKDSAYAQYVTKKRAQEIALQFVRAGMEPRRVLTQGIPMSEPILIDPEDSPSRYRQAIEIIPLDR